MYSEVKNTYNIYIFIHWIYRFDTCIIYVCICICILTSSESVTDWLRRIGAFFRQVFWIRRICWKRSPSCRWVRRTDQLEMSARMDLMGIATEARNVDMIILQYQWILNTDSVFYLISFDFFSQPYCWKRLAEKNSDSHQGVEFHGSHQGGKHVYAWIMTYSVETVSNIAIFSLFQAQARHPPGLSLQAVILMDFTFPFNPSLKK